MAETIFLSTVSNEYGWLRRELAEFLEATNLVLARHQDKFPASDEYTLMMLKSEIERSDVVVHIIGAEKGWVPPPHQVNELLEYFKDNEKKHGSFEEHYKDAFQLAREGKLSATQVEVRNTSRCNARQANHLQLTERRRETKFFGFHFVDLWL